MNVLDIISLETVIILMGGIITAAILWIWLRKKKIKTALPSGESVSQKAEDKAVTTSEAILSPRIINFNERLQSGLRRSRSEVWEKLGGIFLGRGIDNQTESELEELLYGADIGTDLVAELLERLKKLAVGKNYSAEEFKKFLYDFLYEQMGSIQKNMDNALYEFQKNQEHHKTKAIMVVGVNGAGKTTTIGKLATRLTRQGAKVVVGACDTFRAAAVDQLQVWSDRSGAKMIRAKEGTNPSGVAYEALEYAIKEKADYCILDTAGRLHTKGNLMDELAKTKRVLAKLDPSAPWHTLLVLDAITGQNAIKQAEEFHKTLGITGLIFTKCDGSSKAGSAISITRKLKIPISYIGVGETVEDLDRFNLDDYLKALLGL